ncbi:MAG: LuxR C-terminal-related transcriptional regulator, partial [Actinomycetota bacterium]
RPRLTEALSSVDDPLITVVCGPAGAGKSTALWEWANHQSWHDRIGWLSLQRSHNERSRFWTGVIAAVIVAAPELFRSLSGSEISRIAANELVIDRLLDAFDSLSRPIALVIDDYHVITDPSINEMLSRLAQQLPPLVALAIGSRSHPQLHLARLRAHSRLAEIGFDQLVFTDTETTEVVHHHLGAVHHDTRDRLQHATDGWPALVALCAQAARSPSELTELVTRGVATDRWLADFVVDELIDAQPPSMREFMIDVGVLDHLNPDLCDAVRGRTDSSHFIDELDRIGLIVSLDNDQLWWRFHHLVLEVLQRRSRVELQHHARTLHSRAADWLSTKEYHRATVEHALRADRLDLAADHVIPALHLFQVEPGDETRWFDHFPDELLLGNRQLLGEVSLYVRIVGNSEQRRRLERLVEGIQVPDAESEPPSLEIEWQVVLGASVREAAEAIDRAMEFEQSPLWQRFLPGLAVIVSITLDEPRRAHRIATKALATAPDGIFRRTMSGFLSVAQHHMRDSATDATLEPYLGTTQGTVADLSIEWATALSAVRQDDVESTHAHFERARYWLGKDGWPSATLMVEHCVALATLVPGKLDDELFDRAVTVTRELDDCGALEERLTAVARLTDRTTLEADPRRRAATSLGLSEREIEVLFRLAGDASLREIARDLFVSINTVKSHTKSIYRKLGVTRRDGAVDALLSWQYGSPSR